MQESAIFRSGGKQFRVSVGDLLDIPSIEAGDGGEVAFPEVLLYSCSGETKVGTPTLSGAEVVAEVKAQVKGPKIRGFKYKPKKHYKRAFGHRQPLTRIRVAAIKV